jgi:hypothetical protein
MIEGCVGPEGSWLDASDVPPTCGVTPAAQPPDPAHLLDYSPVTRNFPYPEDVISQLAVGASPCPSTTMGHW